LGFRGRRERAPSRFRRCFGRCEGRADVRERRR